MVCLLLCFQFVKKIDYIANVVEVDDSKSAEFEFPHCIQYMFLDDDSKLQPVPNTDVEWVQIQIKVN